MLQHVGIELQPADIDRAVEFFTLLGFEQVEPPPTLADGFTWLERDGTQVHLMHEERPTVPPRGHLAVVVARLRRRPSPACASTASRPSPAASTGAPPSPRHRPRRPPRRADGRPDPREAPSQGSLQRHPSGSMRMPPT